MLAAHFLRRGYPLKSLDSALLRCREFSRDSLLMLNSDPPLSGNTPTPDNERAFSITTFSPMGNPNKRIIEKHWDLLGSSATTQNLYDLRIIHGYRRPPNLRDSLVHAKLKLRTRSEAGISGKSIITCSNSRCRYCPLMIQRGSITSPATGKSFKCCSNFCCNSTNLIYALKCTTCNKIYVGQTKRPFKKRLVEHFSDINKKDPNKPLGLHFGRANHPSTEVLEIYVLKFISSPPDSISGQKERDFHETQWIHRLKTSLPYGLNSMDYSKVQ